MKAWKVLTDLDGYLFCLLFCLVFDFSLIFVMTKMFEKARPIQEYIILIGVTIIFSLVTIWMFRAVIKYVDKVKKFQELKKKGKLVKGIPVEMKVVYSNTKECYIKTPFIEYTLPSGDTISLRGFDEKCKRNDPALKEKVIDLVIDEENLDNYFMDFNINRISGNLDEDYYHVPASKHTEKEEIEVLEEIPEDDTVSNKIVDFITGPKYDYVSLMYKGITTFVFSLFFMIFSLFLTFHNLGIFGLPFVLVGLAYTVHGIVQIYHARQFKKRMNGETVEEEKTEKLEKKMNQWSESANRIYLWAFAIFWYGFLILIDINAISTWNDGGYKVFIVTLIFGIAGFFGIRSNR